MIRLSLRIPEELHARIAAASQEDLRSLNSELLYLIDVGLTQREMREKDMRSTPD